MDSLKHYNGKECKTCSSTLRYVCNHGCVACTRMRDRSDKKKAYNRNYDQKAKRKASNRRRYHAHKEEYKLYKRAYRLARYSLTEDQFAALLTSQLSACAICQREFQGKTFPCIDHDHKCCPEGRSCGNCIRGLLCTDCNVAIGRFYDSTASLSSAIAYLEGRPHRL